MSYTKNVKTQPGSRTIQQQSPVLVTHMDPAYSEYIQRVYIEKFKESKAGVQLYKRLFMLIFYILGLG